MRRTQDEPSYPQPPGSRKPCWREPGEPIDGRPLLLRRPFWKDQREEDDYTNAVRKNPRREGEGPLAYIVRLAELVNKAPLPPVPMLLADDRAHPTEPAEPPYEQRLDRIFREREPGEEG